MKRPLYTHPGQDAIHGLMHASCTITSEKKLVLVKIVNSNVMPTSGADQGGSWGAGDPPGFNKGVQALPQYFGFGPEMVRSISYE